MANTMVALREWAFPRRAVAKAASSAVPDTSQAAASATEQARPHPRPLIEDILDDSREPLNRPWFWAMMKIFGA